ncbi:MAG TPA: twin-arginine translocase TatA/TatE family subunit [Polyangiaceae bacterium]
MFGFSFGEMLVLGVVAIVVVGPRNLPSLMRTAGQLIYRIRKMAMDIRTESGIDEILDAEGIRSEIDNFKRLASGAISPDELSPNVVPDREREYPRVGCDSYRALSEDLLPYVPRPEPPVLGSSPGPGISELSAGPVAATSAAVPAVPNSVPSTNGAGHKS